MPAMFDLTIIALSPVIFLGLYLICIGLGMLTKKSTEDSMDSIAVLLEQLVIFLLIAWGTNALLTWIGRSTGIAFWSQIAAIGGGIAAILLFLRVGRLYQRVPEGIRKWVKRLLWAVFGALLEAIVLGLIHDVSAWQYFGSCIPVCIVWYAVLEAVRFVLQKNKK